jgi:alpha-tubulin suppressor-like RCC1 family protein
MRRIGLVGIIALFVLQIPATADAQTPKTYHWGMADSSNTATPTPTVVAGLPTNIVAFSSGFDKKPGQFNLALTSTGVIYSWGDNKFGVLGNGTTTFDNTPTAISGLPAMAAIASGGDWAAAVDTSGHLWTWGSGKEGEMADGTYNTYFSPHEVPGLTGVVDVAGGGGGGVASLTDGSVVTWGRNTDGELGDGTVTPNSNVPVTVPGLTGVLQVSHSWQTAGALDSSGRVWVWGFTGFGQRGDGTSPQITSTPFQVPLPAAATDESVGGNGPANGHVLADVNGHAYAWGDDASGQVGNATFAPEVTTPTEVSIAAPVSRVEAGGAYSVVLTSKGKVITWGYNTYGDLGDGTTTNSDIPVRLSALPIITAIGTGENSVNATS